MGSYLVKGSCCGEKGGKPGCQQCDVMGDCSYCEENYYLDDGECGKSWASLLLVSVSCFSFHALTFVSHALFSFPPVS